VIKLTRQLALNW